MELRPHHWLVHVIKPRLGLRRNFEDLVAGGRDVLSLLLLKTGLLCKFSCSLSLPPANLEWPTSSFSVSLPSIQEADVRADLGSSHLDFEPKKSLTAPHLIITNNAVNPLCHLNRHKCPSTQQWLNAGDLHDSESGLTTNKANITKEFQKNTLNKKQITEGYT